MSRDAVYGKVHKKGVRDMFEKYMIVCLYADANNPGKTQQREEARGSGWGQARLRLRSREQWLQGEQRGSSGREVTAVGRSRRSPTASVSP